MFMFYTFIFVLCFKFIFISYFKLSVYFKFKPTSNNVGVTIWNKIPLYVKLHSKVLFPKQLKNILISKY